MGKQKQYRTKDHQIFHRSYTPPHFLFGGSRTMPRHTAVVKVRESEQEGRALYKTLDPNAWYAWLDHKDVRRA